MIQEEYKAFQDFSGRKGAVIFFLNAKDNTSAVCFLWGDLLSFMRKKQYSLKVYHNLIHSVMWLDFLRAVTMKMAVFWVVAPCGLVWVYRRFRGLYCLHHMALQPRRQPISYSYLKHLAVCFLWRDLLSITGRNNTAWKVITIYSFGYVKHITTKVENQIRKITSLSAAVTNLFHI
jgi:uncharacterized membrane protein YecN with MAPEG domain